MSIIVMKGLLIGLGGTILMDVWALILYKVFGQPWVNLAPLGRWFWHVSRGKVVHDNIMTAAPYRHELALGWIGHVVVGLVYGVIFVLIMGASWLDRPTFISAWIFGMVTVGAAWFGVQPATGIGWAASKLPNARSVQLNNLFSHTVFAIGMYATAFAFR